MERLSAGLRAGRHSPQQPPQSCNRAPRYRSRRGDRADRRQRSHRLWRRFTSEAATRRRTSLSISPSRGACRSLASAAACKSCKQRHGVPLERVDGHVTNRQTIRINGCNSDVNSYHGFGTRQNRSPLDVWAVADDGVIKAVRHPAGRMVAMMWHPERLCAVRGPRHRSVSRILQVRFDESTYPLRAGRGARMGDRTNDRPKCLVEVGGRSLLSRQVAALRGGGATELGIVRGYRAASISVERATYFENPHWSSTNMVMSSSPRRGNGWPRRRPSSATQTFSYSRRSSVGPPGGPPVAISSSPTISTGWSFGSDASPIRSRMPRPFAPMLTAACWRSAPGLARWRRSAGNIWGC